jgi:hypothetical protein
MGSTVAARNAGSFGTFPMTTEGIDEPLRALDEACRARDVPRSRFRTLPFGDSVRMEP